MSIFVVSTQPAICGGSTCCPCQLTRFGGVAVVRNWGRIGTSGRMMMQTFDNSARAGEALDRLERTKRCRSYAPAVESR
jgi:predicted DNA-binding WGR domain protein